jgi:hypothetical protein
MVLLQKLASVVVAPLSGARNGRVIGRTLSTVLRNVNQVNNQKLLSIDNK